MSESVSEHTEREAAVRDEPVEPPAVPELPDVAGAFVEIRPDIWRRASSVVAIGEGYQVDPRDPTRTHVYVFGSGGGPTAGAPAYRSPFTAAQVLTALRQAEHAEDVRRLEVLAHLLAVFAARAR